MTKHSSKAALAHVNRLAREKSPYLLQHAANPVDWFPWSEEAFVKARQEDKPIFLSIGYSTCHWCHVMERESFESHEVANFLNEHFVSIKVDREERPDVDKIYMSFVQATTGSGGWPLTVFLTPDLKPFYGGTYFPPNNRHGRGSFGQVLQQVSQVWQERRNDVAASAEEIHVRLEATAARSASLNLPLTADTLRQAGKLFQQSYDPRHGGFGGAPKFPQPSQPAFLLRYAKRSNDDEARRMVLHTCDHMAAGGIHDQLGGGFARYSVDAEWLVPHFEKMLYDQAQLVQLYLDAHLVSRSETRNPNSEMYADTARGILAYVLRDMTHPDGGFYSAEDADSEGHEGKFYCWTRADLLKLLTPEELRAAVSCFGITEQGNFVDHSHPSPLTGQNVLSIVEPSCSHGREPAQTMGTTGMKCEATQVGFHKEAEDLALIASAKMKMFAARNQRVRPHLDDKILASWNGLMLGAMARAYAVLGDETYRTAAERNLAFIQAKLWQPAKDGTGILPASSSPDLESNDPSATGGKLVRLLGTLFHRWRDGERDKVQLLEAYAFLLEGVILLYEATLEPTHLDFAIALAESMIAKFYDAENGGFWQGAADARNLILRVKDDYDGAEPSGNSAAVLALLKLAAITDREDLRKTAEATLRFFAGRLQNIPQAMPFMLHALDFWTEEPRRVVIAGAPHAAKTRELLRAAHAVYQPNKVVLGNTGPVEPFARTLPAKNGTVVYLCTGKSCQAPTSDGAKVKEMLR